MFYLVQQKAKVKKGFFWNLYFISGIQMIHIITFKLIFPFDMHGKKHLDDSAGI